MQNIDKEKILLKKVADQFRDTVGIPIKIKNAKCKPLTIWFEWQKQTYKLNGQIMPTLTPGNLGSVQLKLEQTGVDTILITKYVNPEMAKRLKKSNIPFIDAAGNVFLNVPPLYIYVKGNKLPVEVPALSVRRVFQPAGLQVVFALLCNPGLEKSSFRSIAKKAGVALGTVAKVMQDLKAMRYLLDNGSMGRQLLNKKELLDRWTVSYPDQLRPKLVLGYFKPFNNDWWKQTALKSYQSYWGGEVAAWKLTGYLKPQKATIYVEHLPNQLLIDCKMRKDSSGAVEILRKFWKFANKDQITPPLLVYADLLASADARNIEVGKMIYEKEIAQYIG